MKKKKEVQEGVKGLFGTPQPNTEPAIEVQVDEKAYKTVCYSIAPDLDEKMRYIAWYDRKKINAVVADAFKMYIKKWVPAPPVQPKDLSK